MTALLENSDTIVPTPKDIALATESSRVLSAAGLANAKADFKVRLDNGAELTLPNAAMRLISHLLTEMSHGNAVTLIPIHANLTTQEAADYLGVSRPHLIGLLNAGRIKFHKVGTHRRVRFGDLQEYRDAQARERDDALDALAEQAQELKLGY